MDHQPNLDMAMLNWRTRQPVALCPYSEFSDRGTESTKIRWAGPFGGGRVLKAKNNQACSATTDTFTGPCKQSQGTHEQSNANPLMVYHSALSYLLSHFTFTFCKCLPIWSISKRLLMPRPFTFSHSLPLICLTLCAIHYERCENCSYLFALPHQWNKHPPLCAFHT